MKLSIIIVSYNTKKLLADCLKSVYIDMPEIEMVVVDNGSTDGSQAMIKSKFPQAKLIESRRNLGFGKANNLGAKESSGEIIFFLNSDTIVPKGSLGKLLQYFEKNPGAGVVGPKVVMTNGKIQPYSFGDDINLISLIKDKFVKGLPKIKNKVDWVTGAALAVRREAFEAANGFDENFFMYFEDNDLCIRVRTAGYEVDVCSQSKIIHIGGKSIKSNQKRWQIYFQSQDYFFKKHYGVVGALLVKLMRAPYQLFKR